MDLIFQEHGVRYLSPYDASTSQPKVKLMKAFITNCYMMYQVLHVCSMWCVACFSESPRRGLDGGTGDKLMGVMLAWNGLGSGMQGAYFVGA